MAPDKIYLQVCGDCPKVDCKNCKFEDLEDNVTWCKDRIFDLDVEYIRKDALLEWAKNLKDRWEEPPMSKHSPGCVFMLEQVIKKIESL